jgi:hypothetical protein
LNCGGVRPTRIFSTDGLEIAVLAIENP